MFIEEKIFNNFNDNSQYIIIWLFIFSVITFAKLFYKLLTNYNDIMYSNTKLIEYKENLILEELPGLTFILLHTLAWFYGSNYMTKLYFIYWGPMYLITAYLVVFKKKINWKQIAIPSSIGCKFFYIFFVGIFLYLKLYLPVYCYSVWIMHDQVKLAWYKNNADRTRRFFEDYFIFRIGYPLFLLLPFFVSNFYLRIPSMFVSIGILILWISGIIRLLYLGKFFIQPKIEGFGRDIIYL
jgi:hypothetical protein